MGLHDLIKSCKAILTVEDLCSMFGVGDSDVVEMSTLGEPDVSAVEGEPEVDGVDMVLQ